jgi:hypothetical protein
MSRRSHRTYRRERATEAEFVPFSATPDAADVLTFGYAVRPEIGWSVFRQPRRPAAPKPRIPNLSGIQSMPKTHAAILPLANSRGESVRSAGTEDSGSRIGHGWHRMRRWSAAPTDPR